MPCADSPHMTSLLTEPPAILMRYTATPPLRHAESPTDAATSSAGLERPWPPPHALAHIDDRQAYFRTPH